MANLVRNFIDVGGAAMRARHAALELSAAITRRAQRAEIETLRAQLDTAIDERDVLIAQLDVAIDG